MSDKFGCIEFDFLVDIEIHTDSFANSCVQHVIGSFNWDTEVESGKLSEWIEFENPLYEDYGFIKTNITRKVQQGITEGWL